MGLLQSLGASGNVCSSFRPCPPCLPSPASCCQRAGGHKDGLFPAGLQVVPGLRGEGGGRGRPRTEVLPGWSGSGPQIRGPGRPSDSVMPYCRLQTTDTRDFQAQEPYLRKYCPRCIPQLQERAPGCIMCPVQGVAHHHPQAPSRSMPGQHPRLCTVQGTLRLPHLIGVILSPRWSPRPLRLAVCYPFLCQHFSSLLFLLSTLSHFLQEAFPSLWCCVWPWGSKKQECPRPLPAGLRAQPWSPQSAFPQQSSSHRIQGSFCSHWDSWRPRT